MSAICRLTVPVRRLHFPKERLRYDLSLYLVANKPSFQDEHLLFLKCPKNDVLWGIQGLGKIRLLSLQKIVAIGGLNLDCARSIYKHLYCDDGVAMAGGLMAEDDPYLTAQKIQAIREKVRRKA